MGGISPRPGHTIKVDEGADALYIQLAAEICEGEVTASESFLLESRASEVLFDFNAKGQLVGIEIIGVEGLLKITESE